MLVLAIIVHMLKYAQMRVPPPIACQKPVLNILKRG